MNSDDKSKSLITKKVKESYLLKSFLAGIACITAGTVTHPVDLIKTRMQINGEKGGSGMRQYGGSFKLTIKTIVEHEGIKGLYKGLSATWAREGIYSSMRLGFYEPIKKILGATDKAHTPLYKMIAAGAMSGLIAASIANPTDLIKIRMQAWELKPHSIFWHVNQIYIHNGISGFYRGVQATMTRALVVNATQLPSYDFLKHKFINLGIFNDNKTCYIVCSIASGIILTMVSGPFDLARTRLMNQSIKDPIYNGMIDCLLKSINNEGIKSLYKGFTPQWMRFGPFTIVQLTVWEGLRKLFGQQTM